MSDPLIHSCDHYVILEPGKDERFLSSTETLEWLQSWLENMEQIPLDLNNQPSLKQAAKRLLDTACDLEVKPGFRLQWFAVRLDPPINQ